MVIAGVWVSGDCHPHQHFSVWQELCSKEREGGWWTSHPASQPARSSSFPLEVISHPILLQWRQRQGQMSLMTQSWTVTGPECRKPGVCSMVVITSPLCTLHERSAGSSLSPTVAICLIPSRHLRPVLPFYIQKKWSLLSSRGSRETQKPYADMWALPSPWMGIFTGHRLTVLTFANKQ